MAKGDNPVPEPPVYRTIHLHISDSDGLGIESMIFFNHEDIEGFVSSNEHGTAHILNVPGHVRYFNLTINSLHYEELNTRVEIPADIEYDVPSLILYKIAVTLQKLKVVGQVLRKVNDERFTVIECSDFNLLARYLNGENIDPVLRQRVICGYNTLRVFTAFNVITIGLLIPNNYPDYYEQVAEFLDYCEEFGLYVELTAFSGPYQSFFTNDDAKIAHWENLKNCVRNSNNVLLELVNEGDQNANKDLPFDKLTRTTNGILSSHGSKGSESWPFEPHWDYATFHTNEASQWQRKVGHNAMEIWSGPTIANENRRSPDRYNQSYLGYDAAAGAALLCAGSCFHSVNGRSSNLWSGIELDNAIEWAKGAVSIPLTCQGLHYKHREDLENWPENSGYDPSKPTYLRVYQRGNQEEHIARIRF